MAINTILLMARLITKSVTKLVIKLAKQKSDQPANSTIKQIKKNRAAFDFNYVFSFF